jgi:hypothetical protein
MTTNEKPSNPLKQYYRAPKLYTSLPSAGQYDSTEEKSASGEVAVYAMTSKDELTLRNPDALLNGEAVIQLVKSCVPDIANARALPVCDIDILLIAIRMATYGEIMETKIRSPHGAKREDDYSVNLNVILENVRPIMPDPNVVLDNGIVCYVRPFTYNTQTKLNLLAYDQAKAIRNIEDAGGEGANPELSQFKTMFVKLADQNTNSMVDSVVKITTPDGDAVVDKEQIKDFLINLDAVSIKNIDTKIIDLNQSSSTVKQKFICKETNEEFESEVRLDPADFFVAS